MNSGKRQKDRTLEDELPRSVGAQYATGDQWRNNARKNEGMEPNKNNTQLWMGLVIEPRADTVRSNTASDQIRSVAQSCPTLCDRNLECQVHESRQIGSGQIGDDKSEHRHSRNQ